MKCVRLLGLLLAVLLAASCGVRPQSVVKREPVSAGAQRTQKTPADAARGTHVVVRGDTLYAIAFRHGLDYRELARETLAGSSEASSIGSSPTMARRAVLAEKALATPS